MQNDRPADRIFTRKFRPFYKGGMFFFRPLKSGVLLAVFALITFAIQADDTAEDTPREPLKLQTFIAQFADFEFELSENMQAPESFLERKTGDCDDFASLAQKVLNEQGYSTKLIVVMMEKQTHVVCYVSEAEGYLDYNLRSSNEPVTASTSELEDIAEKVAFYFKSDWRMASEIRFENGLARYLDSVFH